MKTPAPPPVLACSELPPNALRELVGRYGMELVAVEPGEEIPGSYWGDSEAGLVGNRLFVRPDTPVQSALHEACHYVCMTPDRRADLHTDAGGGYDEEDAVCYLQVLLADELPGAGRERMWEDMDTWGYTFRLGSAQAWFEGDAADARGWLETEGLLESGGGVVYRRRGEPVDLPEPAGDTSGADGYHRSVFRFLVLALPLVTLELGLGAFVQDLMGWGVSGRGVTGVVRLWEFTLEATALTGLFLLVQGRGGSWWRDGLLAGGVAWVFRGALTVITVARVTSLARQPWVGQAYGWLALYLAAGLLLGFLARRFSVRPS